MTTINWGAVFGVVSLILLQVSFAVGAVLLFFAVKAEIQRTADIYNSHLRETDALKALTVSLQKKLERYEAKVEELKLVKIDGWEDADAELKKQIKTVNARVSAVYSKISREAEDDEPAPIYTEEAGPTPTLNNVPSPVGGEDFGRTVNGTIW